MARCLVTSGMKSSRHHPGMRRAGVGLPHVLGSDEVLEENAIVAFLGVIILERLVLGPVLGGVRLELSRVVGELGDEWDKAPAALRRVTLVAHARRWVVALEQARRVQTRVPSSFSCNVRALSCSLPVSSLTLLSLIASMSVPGHGSLYRTNRFLWRLRASVFAPLLILLVSRSRWPMTAYPLRSSR